MKFGDFRRDFGQANLFFSGPSSTTERHNMTIKRSADGGESFGDALVVYPGASAYSCLASLRGADEVRFLTEIPDDFRRFGEVFRELWADWYPVRARPGLLPLRDAVLLASANGLLIDCAHE